jgi:signal transduction histidine kinase
MMQDFYLFINWAVAIALLSLGIVALLKDRILALNRVFALFTVTIGVWIIASYISNDVKNSPRVSVIGNYFVFLFSYISGYLLAWFAINLAGDIKAGRRLKKFTVPLLLVGITTCTPLVVAGAKRQGSVYAVQFGPLVVLYFLGLVSLLIAGMVVLHKNIKLAKGDQKVHLVLLYRSMAVALPILLITEFILPAITGWFGLTNVGILAMAIPVLGLYYGVVRFKLFNLRLIVVRSLAYVITLAVLSAFYGLISYYATTFIPRFHDSLPGDLMNIVLIIVVAVTYAPLRKAFNKLTNRFFYQDAYEPQAFFDELNKILVSTIDLKELLPRTSQLIGNTLKSTFCIIGIKEGKSSGYRMREAPRSAFIMQEQEITAALHAASRLQMSVVVTDYLAREYEDLKKTLVKNNVEVLVRLTQDYHQSNESLGYIILGPKKSGNSYNRQDIRILDTSANELVVASQNALRFEEIQQFNITLQQRIDEATRKLRNTNDKLRTLDQTKDDFISMASHQLRTPLTSVKGYVSMVLDGDAGPINPMQRKLLDQSFTSAQRMVYLIADLLNISRLKTGKFVIEPSPTNLAQITKDEISQLVETAKGRGLELTYDKPHDFPTYMLDTVKIRQVIMNFVDNAIYYTPSGGHIHVELRDKPKSIELRVIDDGIGVPKIVQHHLFTKFYRAPNALKARPDGTGLGLFMAKKVIVAQGGALVFESTEGKGSVFGFSFAKSHLAVPPAKLAKLL